MVEARRHPRQNSLLSRWGEARPSPVSTSNRVRPLQRSERPDPVSRHTLAESRGSGKKGGTAGVPVPLGRVLLYLDEFHVPRSRFQAGASEPGTWNLELGTVVMNQAGSLDIVRPSVTSGVAGLVAPVFALLLVLLVGLLI